MENMSDFWNNALANKCNTWQYDKKIHIFPTSSNDQRVKKATKLMVKICEIYKNPANNWPM